MQCKHTGVAVLCEADEQRHLCTRCHQLDKLDVDAVTSHQCSRGGSGVDTVDGGRHHLQRTGADRLNTAAPASAAC